MVCGIGKDIDGEGLDLVDVEDALASIEDVPAGSFEEDLGCCAKNPTVGSRQGT